MLAAAACRSRMPMMLRACHPGTARWAWSRACVCASARAAGSEGNHPSPPRIRILQASSRPELAKAQGPSLRRCTPPPRPTVTLPARYLHVTCLYLQLHVAVAAVTRRVPWPASNASTATCEYRFLQVSFHTLPALQLRQLHVALLRATRVIVRTPFPVSYGCADRDWPAIGV